MFQGIGFQGSRGARIDAARLKKCGSTPPWGVLRGPAPCSTAARPTCKSKQVPANVTLCGEMCLSRPCPLLHRCAPDLQISYEKAFKSKLSGNEVYYTNPLTLLVNNMLSSQLHLNKVFNLKAFSCKFRAGNGGSRQMSLLAAKCNIWPTLCRQMSCLEPNMAKGRLLPPAAYSLTPAPLMYLGLWVKREREAEKEIERERERERGATKHKQLAISEVWTASR